MLFVVLLKTPLTLGIVVELPWTIVPIRGEELELAEAGWGKMEVEAGFGVKKDEVFEEFKFLELFGDVLLLILAPFVEFNLIVVVFPADVNLTVDVLFVIFIVTVSTPWVEFNVLFVNLESLIFDNSAFIATSKVVSFERMSPWSLFISYFIRSHFLFNSGNLNWTWFWTGATEA